MQKTDWLKWESLEFGCVLLSHEYVYKLYHTFPQIFP